MQYFRNIHFFPYKLGMHLQKIFLYKQDFSLPALNLVFQVQLHSQVNLASKNISHVSESQEIAAVQEEAYASVSWFAT